MPSNTRAYPDSSIRERRARTTRHVVDRREELAEAAPESDRHVAVEVEYREPPAFVVAWGSRRVRFSADQGIPADAPSVVERVLGYLGLVSIHELTRE